MWSSAPDGGCVGTGTAPRPGRGSFSRENRGAIPRTRDNTSDLWRRSMVRTSEGLGPPGWPPLYRGRACHDRVVMSATLPPDELPLGTDGYPAASGVARRPAGATESARANRRWWGAPGPPRATRRGWAAAAPAYLAEHGRDLGDVEFLWCPEGLREQDAHL